jgi:hypothetical protein
MWDFQPVSMSGARITDPNGTAYLENEYGNEQGAVAFGKMLTSGTETNVNC